MESRRRTTMGAIRDRMLAELELRGMSAATKKSYLTCCRVFVAYFMKSPEQLAAADIKEFLLHLMRQRKAGPSCVGVYVAAIRFCIAPCCADRTPSTICRGRGFPRSCPRCRAGTRS
jgi:hypothetical protein